LTVTVSTAWGRVADATSASALHPANKTPVSTATIAAGGTGERSDLEAIALPHEIGSQPLIHLISERR
jgi:hypothetical protein